MAYTANTKRTPHGKRKAKDEVGFREGRGRPTSWLAL
jgi:hypothetical protein